MSICHTLWWWVAIVHAKIANLIDWLYAACLEYFIFFSIDSSEARKQYNEYCLSIMQTITYAHDRTHIRILIAPVVSSNSS